MLQNKDRPIAPTWEDLSKLRIVMQQLPSFSMGRATERLLFLHRAGLPTLWLANYSWSGSSEVAVTQLLNEAVRQGALVEGPPGYTILGMVLERILIEDLVGLRDGLYIASLISKYNLIDLETANISPKLQYLLADFGLLPTPTTPGPQPPGGASPRQGNGDIDDAAAEQEHKGA